jgi:hypothetical protein
MLDAVGPGKYLDNFSAEFPDKTRGGQWKYPSASRFSHLGVAAA